MKNLIKKYKLSLLGVFLGTIGGYVYYYFIGCTSGSCPLTSNPYISVFWGAMMGYLILSMFEKKDKNQEENKH